MSNVKDDLIAHVEKINWVSFAELKNRWPDYFAEHDEGDFLMMMHPLMGETVIWPAVSLEIRAAIGELLNERRIIMQPGNSLSYLIDGACLSLPIAKQQRVYKSTRWLPCFLRPATKAKRQFAV
jgi:hypothetical protein